MKKMRESFGQSLFLARKLAVLSSAVFASTAAFGQVVSITLPNLSLQPAPNQTFDITVHNSGAPVAVNGLFFNVQVEQGGPDAQSGSTDGPNITGVNLVNGVGGSTAFNDPTPGHVNPQTGGSIFSQLWEADISTTPGNTVTLPSGDSIIGSVTFDATGFSPGSTFNYTLNTINGGVTYTTTTSSFDATTSDGTLTVVPEPAHYAMAFGGACVAFGLLRRKMMAGVRA